MDHGFDGTVYAMGPRVPSVTPRDRIATMTPTFGLEGPSPILAARAETSEDCSDPRLCEKPVGSSSLTLPIALGVGIPLVLAVGVLIYFHRRNVKRQRAEDLNDPHKSLDFGLEDTGAGASRKNLISREKDPQQRYHGQQMSMDMNLTSPYLLPPEAHNSRESLNSLARSLQHGEDPYRPVYAASEVASIRSVPRGHDGASMYSRSNSRQDHRGPLHSPPPRNSMPKSPLLPPEPSHVKPAQEAAEETPMPFSSPKGPLPALPHVERVSSPVHDQDESVAIGAPIQEPPAVAQKSALKPPASPVQPSPDDPDVVVGHAEPSNPFEKPEAQEMETPTETSAAGLGLATSQTQPSRASVRTSTSSYGSRPASSASRKEQAPAATAPVIEEPADNDYYGFDFAEMPELPKLARSPSPPNHEGGRLDVEEPRGRNMQRMSHLYEQQNGSQGGLGVPQQDNRRLSVGFRPLPPDDIMDSEDPEYRANRIRSFYKEYFDETKPEDRPPLPEMPPISQQHQQNPKQYQGQGSAHYYEDYDPNYAQDAPYFDPATNSFVMPYAQPVSRRAMTPPPSGQRFPGPRGPPHPRMRGPPNVRGPPRPGSSVSNQLGGPSRPGSSMSGFYNRARAGSAMSGSRYGGPKKPIPPPADLPTLPTPSKLKDDSFAILNAADFAPPESFSARARGRSQSPMGERRPYKLNVPVHSPLVNAFEELPALPSPHLLRKSGTFTALDFAPPRKFVDADNRSETGSIRSNRSGLSAAQVNAIRGGAGRISRLPGDQIFTPQALNSTLKPKWGMRD
ncbi:hypothetical protein VTK26DRAFT_631 [Humicola hyalothermophila]